MRQTDITCLSPCFLCEETLEHIHLRPTAWLQESGPGRTWDEIADEYDRELRTDEFVMGINLFRRWLVRQAKVQLGASR